MSPAPANPRPLHQRPPRLGVVPTAAAALQRASWRPRPPPHAARACGLGCAAASCRARRRASRCPGGLARPHGKLLCVGGKPARRGQVARRRPASSSCSAAWQMAPPRAPAFTGSALRGIIGGRFRLPALARSSEAGEGAAAAARAGCGAARGPSIATVARWLHRGARAAAVCGAPSGRRRHPPAGPWGRLRTRRRRRLGSRTAALSAARARPGLRRRRGPVGAARRPHRKFPRRLAREARRG